MFPDVQQVEFSLYLWALTIPVMWLATNFVLSRYSRGGPGVARQQVA